MGGAQSQESCDKDSPKYNYHESVLQDAEATFSDDKMAPTEDDEQYFSADESDSVISLTPERTRPESSSAQNSSGTSDDHGSNENASSDETQESSMCESELLVSVDSPANVNGRTSETSHENSLFNVQGQKLVDKSKYITPCQQFFTQGTGVPSPISHTLDMDETSQESTQHVANCDLSLEHEKNFVSPIMATTSSCKRKRCRYLESSGSERDGGKKERHVNICKKRQKSKHHSRGRRVHRSSRYSRDSTSDSDESELGRRNNSKQVRCSCCSNSEESDSERDCRKYRGKCMGQKCKKQRGVNGHVCDRNVARSVETSCCYNMKKTQRQVAESCFADKIESRQDGRCVHNCNHGWNECVHEQQMRQHGAVPSLAEVNVSDDTLKGQVRNHVFHQHEQSLENPKEGLQNMGNLIKLANRRDISSDQSCVNVNNTPSKEQCSHAECLSEPLMQAPLCQKHLSGMETIQNEPVLDGQSLNSERQSASKRDSGVLTSLQENASLSTLGNVSTQKRMDNGLVLQTERSEIAGNSYTSEPTVQTTNSFCQYRKQEGQNKNREKTAADKFMHLFSAAKKEIGSNIKSFISKVTFTDASQNSSKPYWETYLSESNSADKPYLNARQAQAHMAASTKQHCMDEQKAQLNPPLINQGLSYKLQSTVDSSIKVSPSHSSKDESKVSSSLAAQHSCKFVSSRSPQRAGHSDTIKGSKQSLHLKSPSASSFQQIINNSADYLNKCGQSLSQSDTSSVEWLPQDTEHQILHCSLAGAIRMSVNVGDLGEQKTSGIVNWTDGALTHAVTMCSRSIASKAGALMWASCVDYIDNKGSALEAPDVLTTPAGGRFDKSVVSILHVVEPRLIGVDEKSNTSALVEVYVNCLRFANERLGLDSMSFPLIGDGTFPFDICVQSFFDAVLVFLAEQTSSVKCDLTSIQLIIPDTNAASFAADLIHSYLQCISNNDLYCIARDIYNRHFGKKGQSLKLQAK